MPHGTFTAPQLLAQAGCVCPEHVIPVLVGMTCFFEK